MSLSLIYFSMLFGGLSMLSYGIVDYMGALLARKESAVKITLWYFIITSVIMAAIGLAFIKPPAIPMYYVVVFPILSVISVLAFLSFLKGLQVGSISVITPIASAYPIIIVFAGVILLREMVTLLLGAGIALIVLGTVLASFKIKDLRKLRVKRALPGIKYALITLVGWGVLFASVGIISKVLGWFYPILILSVGSAIVLFFYSAIKRVKTAFPHRITFPMLLYVIIGTAAFLFYSIGTSRGAIAVVGPLAGAAPLIAITLAMTLKRERVDLNQAIGIACILIGILILAV